MRELSLGDSQVNKPEYQFGPQNTSLSQQGKADT